VVRPGSGQAALLLHHGPVNTSERLLDALQAHERWAASFGPYQPHPAVEVSDDRLAGPLAELLERLGDNYPYGHPRYAAQMLKPPHPVAVVGYLAAMLVNPNNHALDGGPATSAMEKEVVAQLAAMVGLGEHLGHLTSSGTIANLEALFVAREQHPSLGVAYSTEAHYTHARMCRVLGMTGHPVAADAAGRIDLAALEEVLATGQVGTVVVTTGTTGVGAVDPVADVLALARRHGTRVHVDAAYGGFFGLIADDTEDGVPSRPWRSVAGCDSVVVDPHKHGLQPYGCGAILFRDPAVGRFFGHDSPYTYFTSDQLHLGEISLECSRAGAAAAALWLTLQVFPLTADGLGAVLRPGRRAALRWAGLIAESDGLGLYQQPDLDIVTYFPVPPAPAAPRLSVIDRASVTMMETGMQERSAFLATYVTEGAELSRRGHQVAADVPRGRILRSVLMKPEAELHLDQLHADVLSLATRASRPG
jgi:glutamate/tyrosine decarboxylase-like PLP-dependent enzyme